MKKALFALVATLGMGASVAADNWLSQPYEDEVSGKEVQQVGTFSVDSFELDFPYEGEQRAKIVARKHPRWGTHVVVAVESGQLHCRYQNCYISVRFDDGPVQKFAVAGSADQSTETWFIREKSKFLAALRKSKKTYVELQFYSQGTRTVEFETAGFPWQENAKVKK